MKRGFRQVDEREADHGPAGSDAASEQGESEDDALSDSQDGRHGFLRTAGRIAVQSLVACVALCVASLLWWRFRGAHSPVRLADSFALGGALGIGIGFVSLAGAGLGAGIERYQQARSVESDSRVERDRQDRRHDRRSHSSFLVWFIGGILTIGVGWFAYWVWV